MNKGTYNFCTYAFNSSNINTNYSDQIMKIIKNGIGIYLIFNTDGIGIKKGYWDGTRMHPYVGATILS